MRPTGSGHRESKLEPAISYVLITGVVVSLALEAAGIIMFYRSRGSLEISQDSAMFLQAGDFFRFLRDLASNGNQDTGILLMTLGIAVLVLTPYVRVIASALYFAWTRDIRYLLITTFVLAVLTISLAFH